MGRRAAASTRAKASYRRLSRAGPDRTLIEALAQSLYEHDDGLPIWEEADLRAREYFCGEAALHLANTVGAYQVLVRRALPCGGTTPTPAGGAWPRSDRGTSTARAWRRPSVTRSDSTLRQLLCGICRTCTL